MYCPKCGSNQVNIMLEQSSAKTKSKNMGCLWEMGRLFMIFITCGIWLIFGKRSGTHNTKYNNRKVAICQNCGKKWYM